MINQHSLKAVLEKNQAHNIPNFLSVSTTFCVTTCNTVIRKTVIRETAQLQKFTFHAQQLFSAPITAGNDDKGYVLNMLSKLRMHM